MNEQLIADPQAVRAEMLPPQCVPEGRSEWGTGPKVLFQPLPLRSKLLYRAVICRSLNVQHHESLHRWQLAPAPPGCPDRKTQGLAAIAIAALQTVALASCP